MRCTRIRYAARLRSRVIYECIERIHLKMRQWGHYSFHAGSRIVFVCERAKSDKVRKIQYPYLFCILRENEIRREYYYYGEVYL